MTSRAKGRADEAFDALAHVQRRRILVALLDGSPQVSARTADVGEVDEAGRPDSPVEMQHVHLPKLADSGFVRWNRETGEVRRGADFEEIGPLVELLADHAETVPGDWL